MIPRSRVSSLACSVALLVLLAGCSSTSKAETSVDYPEVVASNFGDMRNVSVCGSIWFGTAPSEEDLELAKRRGVVRVINLSTSVDVSKCDVATVCGHLGLEYLMVPMGPADLGSDRCVDLVLDWLRGSDGRPTLMYYASGGRCASFLAIYRSAVLSVPLETRLHNSELSFTSLFHRKHFLKSLTDCGTAD